MTGRRREMSPEARRAGRAWGLAIVLALASVVVVNLWVLWLVGGRGAPLVSEDYYRQGLAYADIMEAGRFLEREELSLVFGPEGALRLERHGRAVPVTGATLRYYRPDDPELDFRTPVTVSGGSLVPVTAPTRRGRWDATLLGWWQGRRVAATARRYLEP